MSHAIEIRQLHYRADKSFEIPSLDLTVPAGSIYGFLGPNGSGKTTTMRLVLGLLRPRAGEIRVLERPMPHDAPRVLARIGYVPEQPHLLGVLRVRRVEVIHRARDEPEVRDAGGGDGVLDLLDAPLDEVGERPARQVDPERRVQVRAAEVRVDEDDLLSAPRELDAEVRRDEALADAALPSADGDDPARVAAPGRGRAPDRLLGRGPHQLQRRGITHPDANPKRFARPLQKPDGRGTEGRRRRYRGSLGGSR